MHGLWVTDNNLTIVDAMIQEAIKHMHSTVPPSLFHLVSLAKSTEYITRHLYSYSIIRLIFPSLFTLKPQDIK